MMDDLNNMDELINKQNEINSLIENEKELTQEINNILDDTVENKKIISSLNEEIVDEEDMIKDATAEINQNLEDTVSKKKSISSTNEEIVDEEDMIKDVTKQINDILQTTVDKKAEIKSIIDETINRENILLGINQNILSTLQETILAQKQLNTEYQNGSNGANTSGATSNNANGKTQQENGEGNFLSKPTLIALQSSFNYLQKLTKESLSKWEEIDKKVFTTGRRIGLTSSQMRGWQENILANYGEMANRLGMTFEEIFKFQEAYQQAIGRSVVLTNKQVESFAGLSKMIGETSISETVKGMDMLGSSSQRAIDYLTLNMARAASEGLDLQQTSEKFASNIKMASKFNFKDGINGISRMTILSQKLKINMDSIGRAMENYQDISQAISTSANLQVLGGAYAANFANPIQAANEAWLDPEAFMERIVNTVSANAVFDRESGEVKMSPIDKMKMREASKSLNIDYNELWNAAVQKEKIREIEKYIQGANLNETQKAFIANKAEYDAKDKKWYINYMGNNGEEERKEISTIKTPEEVNNIQRQFNSDKAIQGDVHSIRNLLENYLQDTVSSSKTWTEVVTGQQERLKIFGAQMLDFLMNPLKTLIAGMSVTEFLIYQTTKQILGNMLANGMGGMSRNNKGRNNAKGKNKTGGSSGGGGSTRTTRGAKPKSRIPKGGLGRTMNRGLIKGLGRSGAKIAGKSIPFIGTALTIGMGAYDAWDAQSSYESNVNKINNDESLSAKEKENAIKETKRERNTSIGKAAGGATGALAGAAIGMAVGGPVGALIGGLGGYFIGEFGGKAIGSSISVDDAKKAQTSKNKLSNSASSAASATMMSNRTSNENSSIVQDTIRQGAYLSLIQRDVRSLSDHILHKTSETATKITPYSQYENKTFIKENISTTNSQKNKINTIERIDLNVSGTLKVQSGNRTKEIDIDAIFNTPEFQRLLLSKINEGLARNTNAAQTRSLDSTQSILGGNYTPSQLNSK